MRKRILLVALCLAGCASQDTIPEITQSKKPECPLAALYDGNPEGREIGSCNSSLQQLDDSTPKRKKQK